MTLTKDCANIGTMPLKCGHHEKSIALTLNYFKENISFMSTRNNYYATESDSMDDYYEQLGDEWLEESYREEMGIKSSRGMRYDF